jgi:hypothetical protein
MFTLNGAYFDVELTEEKQNHEHETALSTDIPQQDKRKVQKFPTVAYSQSGIDILCMFLLQIMTNLKRLEG